ncbi:MAG: response regulator transcription factor [Actinobacteria bacterium]|nr:response regulator transcription factor [Actinomycetota bacterium]
MVVEDEESFVEALTIGLEREGFRVVAVRDGGEALRRFASIDPDIVLLDLMLPTVSGVDVCREIRAASSVPIIMVTARSDEVDTVVGLEVGADDYVAKPYRLRELIARIRAVLRRRAEVAEPAGGRGDDTDTVFEIGDVQVDVDRHRVRVRGEAVTLPLKEFEVLVALMERAGRVVPRDRLIRLVWGHDYVGDTKTLDVHIKRLRARIEIDPSHPTCIVTVRGVGYRFRDAD